MNKWTDRIYVWGFISLLGVLCVFFLVSPKKAFSEMENRYLQKAPELSWESIKSKKFSDEAELYVTDHFPLRSNWTAAKSVLEQIRLQKENNGIYLGEDGYLFEKSVKPDFSTVEKYAEAVNKFAANHPDSDISFLLAPNSVGVYPNLLPWLAIAYPQKDINEFIAARAGDELTFLNGFDFLKPDGERPLYYRTDHHWTSYGAYLAYRAFAESKGWEPLDEEQFQIRTVTDSFLGSYHTRGQFVAVKPDSIQKYEPKQPVKTEMHILDNGKTVEGLYDESFLAKKDKYSYFQGGVHAVVKVSSDLKPEDTDLSKLLVIKDSYAHSVLPFLTNHVQEIHMIDIRYYNGNISDYMEQNGIKDALLLFNTSTFVQERSLLKLKY
ncbi:DHHW family protein [Paenibacillus sp. GCM10027627]|uniref:DHHW family protein n=1 Tax=unclassified Paenibacillus TaxID=185978 RepID=UPI003636CF69